MGYKTLLETLLALVFLSGIVFYMGWTAGSRFAEKGCYERKCVDTDHSAKKLEAVCPAKAVCPANIVCAGLSPEINNVALPQICCCFAAELVDLQNCKVSCEPSFEYVRSADE